jgi:hypothetical protein
VDDRRSVCVIGRTLSSKPGVGLAHRLIRVAEVLAASTTVPDRHSQTDSQNVTIETRKAVVTPKFGPDLCRTAMRSTVQNCTVSSRATIFIVNSLRPDDPRKEQLAFVSGTVLVWGALLVQLWPVSSRVQTGEVAISLTFHRITLAGESHRLFAIVLALGLGMLLFGAAHVLARGLWLTQFSLEEDPSDLALIDRVAQRTYVIIQIYWVVVVFTLIFNLIVLPSVVIYLALIDRLHWPLAAAQLIAVSLVFVPIFALGLILVRRPQYVRSGLATLRRVGWRNYVIASMAMFVFWLITVQQTYVADLRVNERVFRLSQGALVVATVELGGSASDPSLAQLHITREGGKPSSLIFAPLGDGVYVSTLDASTLTEGRYEIRLTYPHSSISIVAPFIKRTIDRRVGFLVAR